MPQQRTTCQNNNNTSCTTSTQKSVYTIDTYTLHSSKFNLSRDNSLLSCNTLSQINSFFGKSSNESIIINPSSSVPIVCDATPDPCTFNTRRASVSEGNGLHSTSTCKFAEHNGPRKRCLLNDQIQPSIKPSGSVNGLNKFVKPIVNAKWEDKCMNSIG
ncbi:hypothetical protein F8M41_007456 [Gigaspora margarita]|uniref:Uncharacterized protein n=1 Tax=Gigaspora margarita TaxID=4874 RepID=A0A8H4A3C5_GIGMA|nr:hypothetical protein F8M41_007456 [Gigaspora margarita]